MDWNIDNIDNIVNEINSELSNGKTMASIEKDLFNVNPRVIHKRLLRLNYKKIDNQYIKNDITSNITEDNTKDIIDNITPSKTYQNEPQEVYTNDNIISVAEEVQSITKAIEGNIDIDKLSLLLDNLDSLLKLIPKDNITINTGLRSGKTEVKSLRIDTGLYESIKDRAIRDNTHISNIVNKALEDYLNNYI